MEFLFTQSLGEEKKLVNKKLQANPSVRGCI